MDDPPSHALVRASPNPAVPFREDCWTQEATATLVKAWGERYLDLNRGSLRQMHWQEVADAVNAKHAVNKKTRRTDVQCKNRIDTLKKKFKIEKAKASASSSGYVSPWPFFQIFDPLIGPLSAKKPMTTLPAPAVRNQPHLAQRQRSGFASPVPVALRSALAKRLSTPVGGDSMIRKNFSAFAAAAVAAAEKKRKVEDSDDSRSTSPVRSGGKRLHVAEDDDDENDDVYGGGYKELAQAISRFGEIYERVEGSKQRQMIELEKQRMQFAKDLEIHRMELLVDMRLQFERSKRQKRQHPTDSYL